MADVNSVATTAVAAPMTPCSAGLAGHARAADFTETTGVRVFPVILATA